MKDIELNGFKYIWRKDIDGEYNGCNKCSLFGKNVCPSECDKTTGCYSFMTFDEMRYEKRHKLIEQWRKNNQNID